MDTNIEDSNNKDETPFFASDFPVLLCLLWLFAPSLLIIVVSLNSIIWGVILSVLSIFIIWTNANIFKFYKDRIEIIYPYRFEPFYKSKVKIFKYNKVSKVIVTYGGQDIAYSFIIRVLKDVKDLPKNYGGLPFKEYGLALIMDEQILFLVREFKKLNIKIEFGRTDSMSKKFEKQLREISAGVGNEGK